MLALYGTGEMTAVYLDALVGMGIVADTIVVVGRRAEAASVLAKRHGARSARLGEESKCRPTIAIITVTPDALCDISRCALEAGARKLLVEKPGALSSRELGKLDEDVRRAGATAHVAFQRRFLPSVVRCRELIREDGGAVACFFELTELEQRVLSMQAEKNWPVASIARWGIVNPTHVLDLAGWLVGRPVQLSSHRDGRLAWHESGMTFFGTGVSEAGTALVYLATWATAGRWRIEVTTRKRRLILCPLEILEQQLKDSFAVTKIDVPAEPTGMKPGFDGLLRDFLASDGPRRLPNLKDSAQLLATAEQIFGY